MDYVASFIQTFFPDFFIRNFNAIVIEIGVAVGIAIWVRTRKKSSSSLQTHPSVSLSRMRLRSSDVQQVGVAMAASSHKAYLS